MTIVSPCSVCGPCTFVVDVQCQLVAPSFHHVKALGVPYVRFKPYFLALSSVVLVQQVLRPATVFPRGYFVLFWRGILHLKARKKCSVYLSQSQCTCIGIIFLFIPDMKSFFFSNFQFFHTHLLINVHPSMNHKNYLLDSFLSQRPWQTLNVVTCRATAHMSRQLLCGSVVTIYCMRRNRHCFHLSGPCIDIVNKFQICFDSKSSGLFFFG